MHLKEPDPKHWWTAITTGCWFSPRDCLSNLGCCSWNWDGRMNGPSACITWLPLLECVLKVSILKIKADLVWPRIFLRRALKAGDQQTEGLMPPYNRHSLLACGLHLSSCIFQCCHFFLNQFLTSTSVHPGATWLLHLLLPSTWIPIHLPAKVQNSS